ncbi:NAD(P)-binding protein [Pyrenochaeta sp. DS3sAY3a]|nr:NAD(P)-binding protein [Pyrenochaeta sp. DS3sAY3a]
MTDEAYHAPKDLSTDNLFWLEQRTIIVSGGAGAVGRVIAKTIMECGGDVVVVDVLPEPDPEVWSHLQFAAEVTSQKAIYQQLDVQDESSITSAFATVIPQLRHPIRGLVSCAAISGECDACDYPADVFRRILDVNITGTFLIARCVANEMHRANVPGSIVLIASMSGHISNRGINTSAYNASKAAVHQLARSLAAEWGHPQNTFPGSTASATNPNPSTDPRPVHLPIRVNTLSPGHIETPLSAAARGRGLTEEWAKQNMLGRISQPEEYRGPVVFLLGDGSSYMTGADLRVDGGHCAW